MNEGNHQMPATDRRLAYFDGIIPPREWIAIVDGTMHKFDPDKSMRLPKETYQILLDLTRKKNLSVVFVGSSLDAIHARDQLKAIGHDDFPWITCIDDPTNALAFLAFAKFVVANQSPLAHIPAENNVRTIQLEVDVRIPRNPLNDFHSYLAVDEHHKLEEWIAEQL